MVLMSPERPAQASELAEKMRSAIAKHPLVTVDGQDIQCSVSIGYSVARRGEGTWEDLVVGADSALYAAKRAGRDQVCAMPSAVALVR